MKCFHCSNVIKNEANMKLISADGDFVCDDKCKAGYERDRDHFLNVVIQDDKLYERWIASL